MVGFELGLVGREPTRVTWGFCNWRLLEVTWGMFLVRSRVHCVVDIIVFVFVLDLQIFYDF